MTEFQFWLIFIGILLCVGLFIWLLLYLFIFRYKHRFIIKEKSGSKFQNFFFKFREIYDDNNKVQWKFDRKNKYCPINGMSMLPSAIPADAIELDKKGRMVVTATWSEKNLFQWAATPKEEDAVGKPLVSTVVEDRKYEILTSDQLTSYIHHFKNAQKLRKKTMAEHLLALAPGLMLLMIVIVTLAFVPDILDKYSQILDKNIDLENRVAASIAKIDEIVTNKRWIDTTVMIDQQGKIVPVNPPD